ncbi:MAG: VOC family protein [Acidobacteriota bacterium]|jgi:PhnB protein|nr:VOC family protein [Acidobacteriota bacterium]
MKLEMFINFDGNCREAVEFYAKVFKSGIGEILTYGEAPPDPENPVPEADRDRICYAGIPMGGMIVMFMDMPSDFPLAVGNNINPTVNMDDKDEITRIFNELKEGGKVFMELQKTFYSEWYGMVQDKFGIIWHLLHYVQQ